MTTINYTAENNAAAGYVKVEWPGMVGGDDGQVFDCAGLTIASIQYAGNFNGGQGELHASNEVSQTNFVKLDNTGSAEIRPSPNAYAPKVGAVKPVFNGSGGSIAISVIFTK